MKRVRFGLAMATIMAAGVLCGCTGQTRCQMDIEPRADEALRKMSAALGGARSFSFRAVATMDEAVAPGRTAQFSRETRIIVRRPDALFAQSQQGEDVVTLCYLGRNLTMFDKTPNTYAAAEVPSRIDAMLDDVAEKHGLTLPLADLLFADPYQMLTADAGAGRYVGVHEVDGIKCHHLLFTQEALDWQIWIAADQAPVPRKLVIDYKSLPERPQFTALLGDWNLSAPAPDERFKLTVPGNARKVEIEQLLAAGQGE
jgi:hypothetical protein